MTVSWDVLAAILGMAIATFLCRAGGYLVLRASRPSRFVAAMLTHLPGCIVIAFLAPTLARAGAAGWLAAVAVVAAQMATGKITVAILVGVGAIGLLGAALR